MNIAVGVVLTALIAVGVVFMINGIGIFAPSKKPRVQDDPEVITGLIARVTSDISAAAGEVTYTLQGTRHDVAARSVDGRRAMGPPLPPTASAGEPGYPNAAGTPGFAPG